MFQAIRVQYKEPLLFSEEVQCTEKEVFSWTLNLDDILICECTTTEAVNV